MTACVASTATRRVAVIGAGYVGLTTAACLASLGHHVRCADKDPLLISQLRRGQVGIAEPGLADLVTAGLTAGHLEFDVDSRDAAAGAEAVFLCLPTPLGPGGASDLSEVESAATQIARVPPPGSTVIIKSTVPPGTAAKTASLLGRPDVAVASNPEFLREGSAVADFLRPDRIVIGAENRSVAERVAALYSELAAPVVLTTTVSAELAKYAANCFLAMKLSYINEIAELCERTGADITEVTAALFHDQRIGASHFAPGPGWGGPCLPKDTRALLHVSSTGGSEFRLLRAALVSNERQHQRVVDKIRWAAGGTLSGTRISLLGLTFKANTRDVRNSPALTIAALLAAEEAELTAYDPAVCGHMPNITVTGAPYEAVVGADVVALLTEWPEFRSLDWLRISNLMVGDTIIDTRNHLDHTTLGIAGLRWQGIGRNPINGRTRLEES